MGSFCICGSEKKPETVAYFCLPALLLRGEVSIHGWGSLAKGTQRLLSLSRMGAGKVLGGDVTCQRNAGNSPRCLC